VRVVVVVVVVVVIDTMTTTTTMRISTRPPLTAASRQDTRTTPRHTHTPVCVYVCVFVCVRLPLVLGTLSYTYWPVIRTSEAYLLLEREPNVHQMRASTYAHTYIYICVCACVCMRACVCAGNKNQDYVIPTTRCSLIYHHIAQDDDDREDSACVCIYIYVWSILP